MAKWNGWLPAWQSWMPPARTTTSDPANESDEMTLTSGRHATTGGAPASEFDSILQRVMETPLDRVRAEFTEQEIQIAALATDVRDLVTGLEGLSALDGVAEKIGDLQTSVAHVINEIYLLRGSAADTEQRLSEMNRLLTRAQEHNRAVAQTNITVARLRQLILLLTAAVAVQLIATAAFATHLVAG
jgi:hypothetical protein